MKLLLVYAVLFGLLLLVFLVVPTLHQRHEKIDGRWYQAWFINLPGQETVYFPESTVALKDWARTKYQPLAVIVDGREDPEATAGAALQVLGLFTDHQLEQGADGHWVLFKPAAQAQYFTMRAHYRVSPWVAVAD